MDAAGHGVDFRDAARSFAVAVGAFVAMQRYRVGIAPVVAAGGLAGLLVNGLL